MKITGELLKNERTNQKLSIQDVSTALKLSPKIISSLELGQLDQLPAKTFIRGFVKSYAQFLKMDLDLVMRQFQEEMGTTHPMQKILNSQPQPKNNHEGTSQKLRINQNEPQHKTNDNFSGNLNNKKNNKPYFYIGLAVILVILIVATNRVVDRYQKETLVDSDTIAKVQPLTNASTNSSDSTNSISLNQTGQTNSSTAVSADNSLANKENKPNGAIQDLDDGFEPSNEKPVEIIIEAKKELEIQYARGNTKNFSKLKLSPKQVQVIRSPTGLHLKSEDGGAMHLVVNGVDKGQAGQSNKPVKLTF